MHFRALAIFILVITFSCQKQKTPKFSQEIIDLKLASYNMSFFTNERLPNYQKDTLENRLKQIIRLKSAVMADSKPVINLSIKIDWKYKQSEIIVEPNARIKSLEHKKHPWTKDPSGCCWVVHPLSHTW